MINKDHKIYFQAHRGGLGEVPEHTIQTYEYAWNLGAIPEADIQATQDNVIICLHDNTLARTTDAPPPLDNKNISEMTFEEIRKWDAGIYLGDQFKGQKVPALMEVFDHLNEDPERQLYLDLKDVDLVQLGKMIQDYGVGRQIIFCHNKVERLLHFGQVAPFVRTMLWIGGSPENIIDTFNQVADVSFNGMNQIQLHMHRIGTNPEIKYHLDDSFVEYALNKTAAAGIDLELLVFDFNTTSLERLIDLGIRWFATDSPWKFRKAINKLKGI